MGSILDKLKQWYEDLVEANGENNCDDLYFIRESEIKIPFRLVEDIVNNFYGTKDYCDRLEEMLDESNDFVRLLRKENKELRGKYKDR